MTFTTPSMIDLAILFIMGISVFIGIMRGATREVLGIAGWIGAFATVFYGLPLFRPLGRHYIHSPMIADGVVAGLLFILSLAVFILISRTISSSVKSSSLLGGLDRSFGLVFGFLRGALVLCLLYLALGFFYSSGQVPQAIQTARFTPWIAQAAQEVKYLIPKDYLPQDRAHPTINPLDAKDLLENSLPTLEETVRHLSTLKPKKSTPPPGIQLEKLIEKNDTTPQG